MSKRGQVTLFIILCILIVIIFSFIYYTRTQVVKERTEASTEKTTKIALDITPIKTYIEACLEKVSKKGIKL